MKVPYRYVDTGAVVARKKVPTKVTAISANVRSIDLILSVFS